jgi:hypothetical protein
LPPFATWDTLADPAMATASAAADISCGLPPPSRSQTPLLQEFTPRDLPLKSIPGGRMVYQLAAAGRNGSRYVVVALAVSNPFLFDNLRGLLLHWGVSESLTSHWGQPPKGWHTSPSISTVRAGAPPRGRLASQQAHGPPAARLCLYAAALSALFHPPSTDM